MRYPLVIHKDPDSDYGVTVPDLPGCHSGGATIEEAVEMAQEAIEGHIEALLDTGQTVPEPKRIDEHLSHPDYADGMWVLVDVDVLPLLGKTERYNLTLPTNLVERVDNYIKSKGTGYRSRSDFFAKSAVKALKMNG